MDGDAKYLKRKVKAGSLDVHPTEKALGEPQTREDIDWQWPLSRVHSIVILYSVPLGFQGETCFLCMVALCSLFAREDCKFSGGG
jgi:hypothetical protein